MLKIVVMLPILIFGILHGYGFTIMGTKGPRKLSGDEVIAVLCGPDWFDDLKEAKLFVRYYTIGIIDVAKISDLDPIPFKTNFCGVPFRVAVLRIEGHRYAHHIPWLISNSEGKPITTVERLDRELPPSFYVIVSTRLLDIEESGYTEAVRKMDRFVATMRVILGNNLFSGLVREAVVDVSTGNMRQMTDVVHLPADCDGPFIDDSNWEELAEISDRIGELSEVERNRIQLALEFFERASQQEVSNKFFQYWVAIELICDTHSTGKIRTKLVKAYNSRGGYVRNELGFDRLTRLRQELFHKGLDHDLPRDVERYIQATFLDLLRYVLRLECRKHMERHIGQGFDVSRLQREIGRAKIVTIKGP